MELLYGVSSILGIMYCLAGVIIGFNYFGEVDMKHVPLKKPIVVFIVSGPLFWVLLPIVYVLIRVMAWAVEED